ncbi:MAG: sugar transferase [Lachnospiraceae bacterium]|nr:sugar transferase [Lachnospiraceae bacterium]
MYRGRKVSWLKHWDFILLDVVLLLISYIITYFYRFNDAWVSDVSLYRSVALVIVLFALCFGFFQENYHGILRRGYWQEFKEVVKLVAFTTVGMVLYLFILKISASYSRKFALLFPCFAVAFLYIGRILLKYWLRNHIEISKKRAMFIMTSSDNYKKIVDNFLNNPYSEFEITGIGLLDASSQSIKSYKNISVYNGETASIDAIQSSWTDEILFDVPREMHLPDDMIEQCGTMGLVVHLRLAHIGKSMYNQIIEEVEGYTVVSKSMKISSNRQIFFKRVMDIAGGFVGLFLTGILTVIVGPIIYVKSPGPIFFSQTRIGKNGRKFKIYKFRSMYMDAEKRKKDLMEQNKMDGLMFKIDDDPRIIKGIGNFIRETSIDEFPQFWNVLKGDMSLVGTRPPTVDEWEQYELHHRARLATKPGITGMWQVSGRSDITDFEEIVRLDTKYISEWNIGLDIKILFQTIGVVLGRKGSV